MTLLRLLAPLAALTLQAATAGALPQTSSISVDPETQERLGIEVVELQARSLSPVTETQARVVDPSLLAAIESEIAQVQATLGADRAEAERTEKLYQDDRNVSARERDDAAARLAADEARLASLERRRALDWGPGIARMRDAERGRLLDAVARGTAALVRVEMPPAASGPPAAVSLAPVDRPEAESAATPLGPLPGVDAQLQTRGWLAEARSVEEPLPVGRVLVARIPEGGDPVLGTVIPRSALVRRDGALWAWARTEETTFERRRIDGGRPLADGWFVATGFAAGESIVVAGAADLLAAERAAGTGGEDSAGDQDDD